jgi:hypothetical protein
MSNEKEEMTHDKEGDSKFIAEAKRFSDEVRNQYRASLRKKIAERMKLLNSDLEEDWDEHECLTWVLSLLDE